MFVTNNPIQNREWQPESSVLGNLNSHQEIIKSKINGKTGKKYIWGTA